MSATCWINDDGGREAAGFKGSTGDCGTRAIAIATGLDYGVVYAQLVIACKSERRSKRRRTRSHPRTGIYTATFKRFVETEFGAIWTPTMHIGSGCRVHVRSDELPETGRHILNVSKHFSAWIDGKLHDTYDTSRDGTRCVYGFWTFGVDPEPTGRDITSPALKRDLARLARGLNGLLR